MGRLALICRTPGREEENLRLIPAAETLESPILLALGPSHS